MRVSFKKVEVSTPDTLVRSMAIQINISYSQMVSIDSGSSISGDVAYHEHR